MTGEDGLWVSLEDIVGREVGGYDVLDDEEGEGEDEEDDGEERDYGRKVEEQVVMVEMVERREGWDKKGRREGKGKDGGNGAGEI